MSTQADQLGERVIVTGRAYVRIVEAADVLLDRQPVWTELLSCGHHGSGRGYPSSHPGRRAMLTLGRRSLKTSGKSTEPQKNKVSTIR